MANRTDPQADTIHGHNPQFLVDRIVRVKIYNDAYWKEFCFGLTTESLIDEAARLDYVAGTYGGRRRPSKFLCLFLKLLQIQPDEAISIHFSSFFIVFHRFRWPKKGPGRGHGVHQAA